MERFITFRADGVSRSKKQSVAYSLAYAQGTKYHDSYYKKGYWCPKRSDVLCNGVLLPKGTPQHFKDTQSFLDALNASENRRNALLAHKYVIALPPELDMEGWLTVLHRFLDRNFVSIGFPALYTIHSGLAAEHPRPASIPSVGKRVNNPHAHVLIPFRQIGRDGFCRTKAAGRTTYKYSFLYKIREDWAQELNRQLKLRGFEARYTAKSYKQLGIERKPTPHIGAVAMSMEARGIRTTNGDLYREAIADNEALDRFFQIEVQAENDLLRECTNEIEHI